MTRAQAPAVCAVVFPARGDDSVEPAVEALRRQTQPAGGLAIAGRPGEFHPELVRALGEGFEWIWLVEASAVPVPGALEAFVEALGRVGSFTSPVLLTGKLVRPDGELDPHSLPIPQIFDSDLAAGAYERRLLSLRVARRGSLLVHRRGFDQRLPAAAPVPMSDDLVWTGRLLRRETGLLVPASVSVRRPPDEREERLLSRENLAVWFRLVFSDALEPRDRSWFAGRLGEQALSAAAAAARRGPRA